MSDFLTQLINSISNELTAHALRVNTASMLDGTEVPTAPVRLNSYLKTAMPVAATYPAGMIYVTNDIGGATPAFSDGTNWRRVADRNIIS